MLLQYGVSGGDGAETTGVCRNTAAPQVSAPELDTWRFQCRLAWGLTTLTSKEVFMGSRDTSNVFSTLVLLVLTSSECVCCRLGEMARGQAGVPLVWPSGSVQFKVEPDAARGFFSVYNFTALQCQT